MSLQDCGVLWGYVSCLISLFLSCHFPYSLWIHTPCHGRKFNINFSSLLLWVSFGKEHVEGGAGESTLMNMRGAPPHTWLCTVQGSQGAASPHQEWIHPIAVAKEVPGSFVSIISSFNLWNSTCLPYSSKHIYLLLLNVDEWSLYHVCAMTEEAIKKDLDLIGLELQILLLASFWVLGIKCGSPDRVTSALNHWSTSSGPIFLFPSSPSFLFSL